MAARPALFPEPPRDLPGLSAALATPAYRLERGGKAKWTHISVKTIDCVECAQLQHETRGAFGPRRQAKWRRVLPDGQRLDLCRAHEMAWRERDKTDSAMKGTP